MNLRAVLLSLILFCLPLLSVRSAAPNIVLIYTDDMGINDIGAYAYPRSAPWPASGPTPVDNTQFNPLPPPNAAATLTPRIDSLAADGIRFTDFYTASPVCTPARAALLTGSYATRVQLERVILPSSNVFGLHPAEVTLPERLRDAGYHTAIVGKWHLGDSIDFHPTRHGFNEFLGISISNDVWDQNTTSAFAANFPPLIFWEDEAPRTTPLTTATGGSITSPINTWNDQAYLLEALTERALDVIDRSHAAQQPFFLYYAVHAPHVPCVPHPDFAGDSGVSTYYDVMMELDHRVGQILDRLDALGIADNTLVLFTSDNGPWHTRPAPERDYQPSGSAYPFRGYKRLAFEGGSRMPFLARWTGTLPAGVDSSAVLGQIDLMPTLLALAGLDMPADRVTDGIDFSAHLQNPAAVPGPRTRFFFYEENDTNAIGLREGDWKLLNGALYNLATDPQETTNLAASQPARTSAMQATLSAFNSAMTRRARGLPQSNRIEIDTPMPTVDEGGAATLRIRLAAPADTTVQVQRFSGSDRAGLGPDSTLTFTTANWDQWQDVTLEGLVDPDGQDNFATLRLTATGLYPRDIPLRITDRGAAPDGVPPAPAQIPGLVGWYDASQLAGDNGAAVTRWPDRTDDTVNTVAHDLTPLNPDDADQRDPVLATVSHNGFAFRAVRFAAGANGEFEQLQNELILPDGHATRTLIAVYTGGINNANSRPLGFGSLLVNPADGKKLWNLATDGQYGSARFDGAFIGPYSAPGLTRSDLLLRTAVMHNANQYSEYISLLDDGFQETRRLDRQAPSAAVGPIRGSFHVGDLHTSSPGGGVGAASFDLFEILIYDRVLSDAERQQVQLYLRDKYTTDPLGAAEAWREFFFGHRGPRDEAADDADPDNDGLSNRFERAFGGSPIAAASAPFPSLSLENGTPVFRYDRNNAEFSFQLLGTGSLLLPDWQPVTPAATTLLPGTPYPGIDRIEVTLPPPGITPQFLRLEISPR
jgi:arylsulfatase A-like enzyme